MHNPMMAQLEDSRLKVFRAATEHLNCHKAAVRLLLTHPAVTLQVKAMESDLGMRLFDCAGETVSLTRQGSVLLTYANEVAAMFPKRVLCIAASWRIPSRWQRH